MIEQSKITDSEIKTRLFQAHELLERGWIQGVYYDEYMLGDAAYCLIGALNEVCTSRSNIEACKDALRMTIIGYRDVKMNLVAWNDKPGRTKGEVLDLVRQTIDRLESEMYE